MKTSDSYRPCQLVFPGGVYRLLSINKGRFDSIEGARAKLAAKKVAWVRPEDLEEVLRGEDR